MPISEEMCFSSHARSSSISQLFGGEIPVTCVASLIVVYLVEKSSLSGHDDHNEINLQSIDLFRIYSNSLIPYDCVLC